MMFFKKVLNYLLIFTTFTLVLPISSISIPAKTAQAATDPSATLTINGQNSAVTVKSGGSLSMAWKTSNLSDDSVCQPQGGDSSWTKQIITKNTNGSANITAPTVPNPYSNDGKYSYSFRCFTDIYRAIPDNFSNTVTVTIGDPPPITGAPCTFTNLSFDDGTVNKIVSSGSSVGVKWQASNVTVASSNPNVPNNWNGAHPANGTANNVGPFEGPEGKRFTLTMTCPGTGSYTTLSTTKAIYVTLGSPTSNTFPTVDIKVGTVNKPLANHRTDYLSVTQGKNFDLTWTSTKATSCTASGGGAQTRDFVGPKKTSGSFREIAQNFGRFTYTISCTGNNITTTDVANVDVGGTVVTTTTSNGTKHLPGVEIYNKIGDGKLVDLGTTSQISNGDSLANTSATLTIEKLPVGQYHFIAQKDNLQNIEDVVITEDSPEIVRINMDLAVANSSLAGTVTYANGTAAPSAQIGLFSYLKTNNDKSLNISGPLKTTVTDANGQYIFNTIPNTNNKSYVAVVLGSSEPNKQPLSRVVKFTKASGQNVKDADITIKECKDINYLFSLTTTDPKQNNALLIADDSDVFFAIYNKDTFKDDLSQADYVVNGGEVVAIPCSGNYFVVPFWKGSEDQVSLLDSSNVGVLAKYTVKGALKAANILLGIDKKVAGAKQKAKDIEAALSGKPILDAALKKAQDEAAKKADELAKAAKRDLSNSTNTPVNPYVGSAGKNINVSFKVKGVDFRDNLPGIRFDKEGMITVENIKAVSKTEITATFKIAENAVLGNYVVTIFTPGGKIKNKIEMVANFQVNDKNGKPAPGLEKANEGVNQSINVPPKGSIAPDDHDCTGASQVLRGSGAYSYCLNFYGPDAEKLRYTTDFTIAGPKIDKQIFDYANNYIPSTTDGILSGAKTFVTNVYIADSTVSNFPSYNPAGNIDACKEHLDSIIIPTKLITSSATSTYLEHFLSHYSMSGMRDQRGGSFEVSDKEANTAKAGVETCVLDSGTSQFQDLFAATLGDVELKKVLDENNKDTYDFAKIKPPFPTLTKNVNEFYAAAFHLATLHRANLDFLIKKRGTVKTQTNLINLVNHVVPYPTPLIIK